MIVLTTIISGGQTGADQAGLMVARALGLKTGGWAPKGYRTETGPDLTLRDLYGLQEHSSGFYGPRTSRNVRFSDGTAIFGDVHSAGSRLTARLCDEYGRPHIANPSPVRLRAWLDNHQIRTLNVAGNRASKCPGIGSMVQATIRAALVSEVLDGVK